MAKYTTTKTILSAKPKVRTSDNVVVSWDLEVEFNLAADDENGLPEWSTTYSHTLETEDLGKTVTGFSKEELIGLFPSAYDNVFNDHYEHFNNINQPTIEIVEDSEFDINSLS